MADTRGVHTGSDVLTENIYSLLIGLYDRRKRRWNVRRRQGVKHVFRFSGWLLLVVALPVGVSESGVSSIMLLDREPFYAPSPMTIVPGQLVQWHNQARQPHTVTHDGCGRGRCAFASGHLHPGERFSVRDLPSGTYAYHCDIHPFMRGVLQVRYPQRDQGITEL